MYNSLKDTQSLLTELWDKAFSKEVIEEDLRKEVIDWDKALQNQIEFLKIHQVENEKILHLFDESISIETIAKLSKQQSATLEEGRVFVSKKFD